MFSAVSGIDCSKRAPYVYESSPWLPLPFKSSVISAGQLISLKFEETIRFSIATPWTLLQSVAWFGMFLRFSQEVTLDEAISIIRTGLKAEELIQETAGTTDDLKDIEVELFGKKGLVSILRKRIPQEAPERRKDAGRALNDLGGMYETAFNAVRDRIASSERAARLAADGYTGPETVLDGKFGFLESFCQPEGVEPELLTTELSQRWETLRICMKRYACHVNSQTPVQALRELMSEHHFAGSDVLSVTVEGAERLLSHHDIRDPGDAMQAQYSVPFLMWSLSTL